MKKDKVATNLPELKLLITYVHIWHKLVAIFLATLALRQRTGNMYMYIFIFLTIFSFFPSLFILDWSPHSPYACDTNQAGDLHPLLPAHQQLWTCYRVPRASPEGFHLHEGKCILPLHQERGDRHSVKPTVKVFHHFYIIWWEYKLTNSVRTWTRYLTVSLHVIASGQIFLLFGTPLVSVTEQVLHADDSFYYSNVALYSAPWMHYSLHKFLTPVQMYKVGGSGFEYRHFKTWHANSAWYCLYLLLRGMAMFAKYSTPGRANSASGRCQVRSPVSASLTKDFCGFFDHSRWITGLFLIL